MKNFINWICYEEGGQGIVEYSLIFALVAIVAIVAISSLGNETLQLYEQSLLKMP